MTRRHVGPVASVTLAVLLAACIAEPPQSPTPTVSPTPVPTTAAPTPSASPSPSATVVPTATPNALSLPLPDERDERRVRVSIAVDVPADGDGVIDVTVESLAETLIDEVVLRWPRELHATLFPAPFVPSEDRIRDGGPPLVQQWTKWVVGPGERGEPAGTVSLGYGPLAAGGTLDIRLFVTRRTDGPVSFDLQVLAGEALLTLADRSDAELRIEVP